MININKRRIAVFGFVLSSVIFTTEVFAQPPCTPGTGPFTSQCGKAITPTKYVVTVKYLAFRNKDTGEYVPFFSGSTQIDLGSGTVVSGGVGGIVGDGATLDSGTYDGIRVIISRDFIMNGSDDTVSGPDGIGGYTNETRCSTGGTGKTLLPPGGPGYTVDNVLMNLSPVDQVFSIPPEADGVINAVDGLKVVDSSGDIQVTASINSFTVLPGATTPDMFADFDVKDTVEFLHIAIDPLTTACFGILLPPVITLTPEGGNSTKFEPKLLIP